LSALGEATLRLRLLARRARLGVQHLRRDAGRLERGREQRGVEQGVAGRRLRVGQERAHLQRGARAARARRRGTGHDRRCDGSWQQRKREPAILAFHLQASSFGFEVAPPTRGATKSYSTSSIVQRARACRQRAGRPPVATLPSNRVRVVRYGATFAFVTNRRPVFVSAGATSPSL